MSAFPASFFSIIPSFASSAKMSFPIAERFSVWKAFLNIYYEPAPLSSK
jgi:hypothetical protein